MSGVLNDCDALLQGAGVRILNGKGAYINLALSAPGFHLNSAGVADLSVVTVKADLIGLSGAVAFTAQGGTLSNGSANAVDVTYAGSAAEVTATLVSGGETITRSIAIPVLRDGAAGSNGSNGSNGTNGTNGVSPPKNAVAFLYKWSTATPSKPAGTTTFTWAAAANTTYSGNDGWAIAPPANPGTPLIQLFVASIAVSDAAAATSTTVGYTNSIVAAWAQNGANGSNGSNGTNGITGVQSGEAKVYQWAATIPAGPAGSPSFVWSTSAFGAAPTNWTLTPGAAPSPGMTLWMARVGVTDSAAATSTSFNWTAASILAVGYAGANGSNGSSGGNGAEGASYVTAYCASSTASTTTAPSLTSGKSSVPASNGGGIVGAWTKAVPVLASGQFLYQSDGIYDPATGNVTWSIPYWSSLKVGTLSAITANLGAITGGSIDIGSGASSWHVDAQGNMWIGAATFAGAPVRISNTGAATFTSVDILGPGGVVVLSSGKTLAEQSKANPNLIPRISSWPVGSRYNGATWFVNTLTHPSLNGELISLPASGASFESDSLRIPPNVYCTISFGAHCYNGSVDVTVDLYGPNVDSAGIVRTLTGTPTQYSFTEIMTVTEAPLARLRVFATAGTGTAEIYNVKVEFGTRVTAWCDSVITPSNVSQYVMPNAITNTQFGGDLFSTNWNGNTGLGGAGWLLRRDGTFFGNNVVLRGSVSNGAMASWYSWPSDPNQKVAYFGPEGFMLGNFNSGKYVHAYANGDLYLPGFQHVNGQLTLNNPVIVSPRVSTPVYDSFSLSSAGGGTAYGGNGTLSNSVTLTISGNNGPHKVVWNLTRLAGGIPSTPVWMDASGNTASISATASNTTINVQVSAVVTGADGRTLNFSDVMSLVFGSA